MGTLQHHYLGSLGNITLEANHSYKLNSSTCCNLGALMRWPSVQGGYLSSTNLNTKKPMSAKKAKTTGRKALGPPVIQ